jgi:hypothetical protein
MYLYAPPYLPLLPLLAVFLLTLSLSLLQVHMGKKSLGGGLFSEEGVVGGFICKKADYHRIVRWMSWIADVHMIRCQCKMPRQGETLCVEICSRYPSGESCCSRKEENCFKLSNGGYSG